MEKSPRERYAEIVSSQPDMTVKGNKTHYTAVNGNMFSFVDADDAMSLRLPQDQRDAFIVQHNTALSVQYNTVMKEYVVVPDALLKKTALMKKYFAASCEYARSLKPKATTKKKTPNKKTPNKKTPNKKTPNKKTPNKKTRAKARPKKKTATKKS